MSLRSPVSWSHNHRLPYAAVQVAILMTTFLWQSCASKSSIYIDYAVALRYMQMISVGEADFLTKHGHYANLDELWHNSTEPNRRAIALGMYDDFRFEVQTTSSGYSICVWPASHRRIVSLHLDENGVLRMALHGARATGSSKIINDHLN